MAVNPIPPMDISGLKSELSERWRVWLRGFTYFAEGKANYVKPREKEKRDALSGRYWSENLVIVPLPECQAGDVYQQAVRALNTHLHTRSASVTPRTWRRCGLIHLSN